MAKSGLKFEYFLSVTQRKVEWLWYPYIPYGKLTVLQGDPGEGKSTFILRVAALLTEGKSMPDGFPVPKPQSVVYQSAEDNLADTVKPHLAAAGADCDRVAYIIDGDNPLTLDDSRIEDVIVQAKARPFILDPLQAYLSQDADMFNPGQMRRQLRSLANIAAKHKCAVIIIRHMNKTISEKNLYRGFGTIDIAAIARSVLAIVRDRSDSAVRYMLPVKSSLAPKRDGIAFPFSGPSGFTWLGQCGVDRSSLEDYATDESKWELASRIVSEILSEQDMHSVDILRNLKLMGVSERTIHTAKRSWASDPTAKAGHGIGISPSSQGE